MIGAFVKAPDTESFILRHDELLVLKALGTSEGA